MREKLTSILKSRRVLELILAPLALVTLFLVACGRFLRGDKSIATFMDNTHLYLPFFNHISASFNRGEYPYWIDSLMGGIPLYDNPNFSLVYPLYFFHSGVYTDMATAMLQMHYVSYLHVFIAYVNCYVLLRVLRLSPLPALLGASVFAFSQNLFTYTVWVAIIAAYSWLPLALAGAVLIIENRRVRIGIVLTTGSLTLITLASPAHALIHAAYLIGILFLCKTVSRWRKGKRGEILTTAKNFVIAAFLTVLLGAPALIPVLVHMKDMIRFASYDPPVIGFGRLTYQATLYGQLGVGHLAGALLPYEVPSTIGHPYVGFGVVMFALIALLRIRAHWVVLPLFFVSIYALVSSAGGNLGLARLNYVLPLLDRFREPDRHLFVFVLGMSVLAAFGFRYALRLAHTRRPELVSSKHLLMLAAIAGMGLVALSVNLRYVGLVPRGLVLLLPVLALFLILASRFIPGKARMIPAFLAALLVIFTTLLFPRLVPDVKDGDFFSAGNLESHQVLKELARMPDARQYRFIFADPDLNQQKWAMNASYYGLRSFYAFSNILPYEQFVAMYLHQIKPTRYSLMLGAKYYLCTRCEGVPPEYRYQQELNRYKLYTADQALPRYSVTHRIAGVYDSWEDLLAKINLGGDFPDGVYLTQPQVPKIEEWLSQQPQSPQAQITEEGSSLNRVRLKVETPGRSMLVLNEYYNGAWRATINGMRAEVIRVNANQMGVLVDKGSNVIEFEYAPTLYIWLLRLQVLALILVAFYALYLTYYRLRANYSRFK